MQRFFLYYLFFLVCPYLSLFDDTGIIAYFATPCPEGWEKYSEGDGLFILSKGEYNTINYALNTKGEEDKVQLKIENMASHNHANGEFKDLLRYTSFNTTGTPGDFTIGEPDIYNYMELLPVGNDVPHNNMPQYLVLSLCIKTHNSFTLKVTQNAVNDQLNHSIIRISTNSQKNLNDLNESFINQFEAFKMDANYKILQINTQNTILSSKIDLFVNNIDRNTAYLEGEFKNNITELKLEMMQQFMTVNDRISDLFTQLNDLSSKVNKNITDFLQNFKDLSTNFHSNLSDLSTNSYNNLTDLSMNFSKNLAELSTKLPNKNDSSNINDDNFHSTLAIGIVSLIVCILISVFGIIKTISIVKTVSNFTKKYENFFSYFDQELENLRKNTNISPTI